MRRRVVSLCLLLAACGGGPRAPEAPAAAESKARAASVSAPSGELATSELPTDSVFWLRVRSMTRDLPALARFDLTSDEVKTVLENPRFLAVALIGEEIARWVDLDAPVDILLGASEPYEATFALRPNQDFAKGADVRRHELEPGRFRLEPAERSNVDAKHCELWESATAGDRILCAPNEQRVVRSAAFFFGRAASASNGGPAFRAEVSGRALWTSVLEEVEHDQQDLGGAPNERAGAELGMRWARALFGGNRALVAELDLVQSEAELGFELVFEGEGPASTLKRWFGSDRPRALPGAFSKLPGDSELTFGYAGTDPGSATESIKERLREFSAAGSSGYEITERDRQDVEAVTFEALPPDGRFALALGHDKESVRQLLGRTEAAEDAGKDPAAKDVTNLASALAGWALVGIEADPNAYVKNLRRLVEVYERPFPKKKPGGSSAANAAGVVDESRRPLLVHVEVSKKALPNVPKGSLHLVVTERPNPDYKPPPDGSKPAPLPHDVHVVVVPEGGAVWIGIARDEKVAAARARAQLGSKKGGAAGVVPSPGAGNRTVAAASLTLGGLVEVGLDGDTPEARDASSTALAKLAALPSRGRTKILARVDVVPHEDGTTWSVVLRGRVSLPAIKDIVALLSESESVVGVFQ